ncbi:nickel insertion protein [Paenibacillus sp. FJAT-26967]|uniref:nickel insertion protein n=1 Tax=Paenibacillus sp. FJAT-26967 TaxID=1729690 RepID=UPI0008393CEA|nr:nickel insertion protein [Paenibacillus sp. FJAT-26967]
MSFDHREEHRDPAMLMVQANLDDMNPEWTSYVSDRLFEEGANDVYWIPILMKKGRPGIMLNVLVEETRLEAVETVIFRETTTLGIRYAPAVCHRLSREFHSVETSWGLLTVKAGYHRGKLVQYAPEFAECSEIARKHGIPLKSVYDEVRMQFSKLKSAPAPE